MRGHRFPHERARWLSAVLLVAAIVGVSLAVGRWPVAAPAAARLLASRPLRLIEPPSLPLPALRVAALSRPPVVHRHTTDDAADAAPVDIAVGPADGAAAPEPAVPVAASLPSGAAMPLLAGRRLELSGSPPMLRTPDGLATVVRSSSSHGLVDMPAVAVTRVVSVAGRGIRTGLRATGAMFRAAF